MSPTILFVPGYWEGPTIFADVSSRLESKGFKTDFALLPSTGRTSPGNPNMHDDIAAIRGKVAKLIDAGEEIVMVLHSAGGFLGSNAIDGLSTRSQGFKRGVRQMVFLAAGVYPEGFEHSPLPCFEKEDGALTCKAPEQLLFEQLGADDRAKWTKLLQPQPAEGWDGTVTYCGWREVPSTYLVCEDDQVLPPPIQNQMAELAGSKIFSCGAGHMPMLSTPEKVVEVIESAVHA